MNNKTPWMSWGRTLDVGLREYRVNYRGRRGHFDPRFFTMQPDRLQDEDGKVLAEKDRLVPKSSLQDRVPASAHPDRMFRGMSHAEYQNFKKTGHIKSLGTYNIGPSQEGLTYFTTEPQSAESYASSFAPRQHKPDWKKPAYIVEARRTAPEHERRVQGTGSHEIGVTRPIHHSEVTAVYRGNVVAHDPGEGTEHNGVSPSSWLHWQKVAPKAKVVDAKYPVITREEYQALMNKGHKITPAGLYEPQHAPKGSRFAHAQLSSSIKKFVRIHPLTTKSKTQDALHDERTKAFNALASAQRGEPEAAMLRYQRLSGGGVMSHAVEHTGDLTHRMAEHGGRFGSEYVAPKVRSVLSSLRHGYGFAREHGENLQRSNIHPDHAKAALTAYAQEHMKLPVYNRMQEHARNAAIHLGLGNYDRAEHHLSALETALKQKKFNKAALEYDPNYPGKTYRHVDLDANVVKPYPKIDHKLLSDVHDPNYVYHATSHAKLHDIARSGNLRAFNPGDFSGKRTWPDGEKGRRAYFAKHAKQALAFGPQAQGTAVLRTKKGPNIEEEKKTGDFFSKKDVPSHDLEYLHSNGKWMPLKMTKDSEFHESEHPRGQPDNSGQFVEKGKQTGKPTTKGGPDRFAKPKSAGTAALTGEAKTIQGPDGKPQRVAADGKPLPHYIQALKLPPAWTDVRYSEDPAAALLATGKDAKGRSCRVYNAHFSKSTAEIKFKRVREMMVQFDTIKRQNARNMQSTSAKTRDLAEVATLIMETGIRPGSERDRGAATKAYGATTLLGKHVVIDGKQVSLQFTGKKGVSLNIPVRNNSVAQLLISRAQEAGPEGKLFPHANETALVAYVSTLDGGGFKTKDFRTCVATSTALREVDKYPAPTNKRVYEKQVLAVARTVSEKLGNTPTIALQSYINPTVFSDWRVSAGIP